MSRVLVIGGTLFIGKALVRRLLARGDRVTILHRSKAHPYGSDVEQIRCDRNDVRSVRRALEGRSFDLVFDNVYDWRHGTTAEQVKASVLACADGLRRYVFMSSVAAYGQGERVTEDAPLAPPDHPEPYIRNKAETERMLFALHRDQAVPVVTLRPPFIYGPENPFYREAFFWDRLLVDRPIVIPGYGSRYMHFVFVEDLADAALLAATKDEAVGRAYNVANDEPLTQAELVRSLGRAAEKTAKLVFVPREKIHAMGGKVFEPPYYFGQYLDVPPITENTERAHRELGFRPTSFEQGLKKTFLWYQSQTGRPTPDFSFEDRLLVQ